MAYGRRAFLRTASLAAAGALCKDIMAQEPDDYQYFEPKGELLSNIFDDSSPIKDLFIEPEDQQRYHILIGGASQQYARVMEYGAVTCFNHVSTGKNGFGGTPSSGKTPTGLHEVVRVVGKDYPLGTVFQELLPVYRNGELWVWRGERTNEDLMLSPILILEGLEPHNKTTRSRSIYIHATNREEELGMPLSRGCIRMARRDLGWLVHHGVGERSKVNIRKDY